MKKKWKKFGGNKKVRIFAARLRNKHSKMNDSNEQEFIENIERDNEVKKKLKEIIVCKFKIREFFRVAN
ncbi:MAG: hypothetical protein MJZ16_10675 [Bacteroidales bacterium]|nr:hypothetical protein [Bacteroidales bacterium]